MIKHAINYGLILGMVLTALSAIEYMLGLYGQSKLFSALTFIVFIGGVYYCSLKYRNDQCDGYILYGKALLFGVLVSAFAYLVNAIFVAILITVIDTDYINRLMDITYQQLQNQGLSEAIIEQSMEITKKFMSPLFIVFSSFFGGALIGFIVSLIIAAIIQKKQPEIIQQ